jgi:hypothetical protein
MTIKLTPQQEALLEALLLRYAVWLEAKYPLQEAAKGGKRDKPKNKQPKQKPKPK